MLAIGAALAFAGATLLQFDASQAAPRQAGLRFGLLAHLFEDRRFNVGVVLDVVGGAAQFFALKEGSVELVMPLVASGLVLAIALHHLRRRLPIGVVDAVALAAAAASLLVILEVAPAGVDRQGSLRGQLAVTTGALILGGFALTLARGALLGRAARTAVVGGVLLGAVALLERSVGIEWATRGALGVLESWQLYALAAVGATALVVVQSAFAAGRLLTVAPIVAVAEPIVASALAVAVEGLGARPSAGRLLALFVALVVEGLAIVVLAAETSSAEARGR